MHIFLNVLALGAFVAGAVGFYRAGALRELFSHLDEDCSFFRRWKKKHQDYRDVSCLAFVVGSLILLANWVLSL